MNALKLDITTRGIAYQLATHAPRVLVALAALLGASSCVSAKRYEDAQTAAFTHAEARQTEYDRRRVAEQRVSELNAELERQGRMLEQGESSLANSKLETTVALKDRDSAELMIDQLRSDLARAGQHMAWFSGEKRDLGKALLLAEQRMVDVDRASGKLAELIGAGRDLALVLGDGGGMGDLGLAAKDGRVELEVPAARLFAEGSDALIVDAAPVLAGVARVASAHEPLKITLRAPGDADLEQKRAQRLTQALSERGLAEGRCSIELTPAAAAAAPAPAPAPAPVNPEGPAAEPAAPQPAKPYVFAFAP